MVTSALEEAQHWSALDPLDVRASICGSADPLEGLAEIDAALEWLYGEAILDLGCGPGRLTNVLADRHPDCELLGVDISLRAVAAAREHRAPNATFEVCNGRVLDLARESVDGAYSMLLFQHLDADAVAGYIYEAACVLVPGGRFVFQYVEGDEHAPFNHRYPPALVHRWCADAGFIIRDDACGGEVGWRWLTAVKP